MILSIFADPSNQLGILLLLSIFATTISSSDRHISFVQLRPSLRACFGHVARLFASVANAVKKSAATTAMSIPTATTTNSDLTLGVVDLMRAIVVAVVRLRAAAVLAKARLLLKTLEEELLSGGQNVATISEVVVEAACSALDLSVKRSLQQSDVLNSFDFVNTRHHHQLVRSPH